MSDRGLEKELCVGLNTVGPILPTNYRLQFAVYKSKIFAAEEDNLQGIDFQSL